MAGDLHAKKYVLMTVGRLYRLTSEVAFLLALPELSHSMRYGVEDRCEILMYSRVHSAFAATFALSHMKWTCFRKRQSSQLPAPALGDTALKIAAKYSCTRVYTPLMDRSPNAAEPWMARAATSDLRLVSHEMDLLQKAPIITIAGSNFRQYRGAIVQSPHRFRRVNLPE